MRIDLRHKLWVEKMPVRFWWAALFWAMLLTEAAWRGAWRFFRWAGPFR